MMEKTFSFTNEMISADNLGDGRHVVKVTPGGTTIAAYVSNGRVTSYEAEGPTGDRVPLLTMRPDRTDQPMRDAFFPGFPDDGLCQICTYDHTFDSVFCYTVLDCPPQELGPKGPHTPEPIPFPTS